MRLHVLTAEEGTLTEAGWVLKTWCWCDLLFAARAVTLRKAKRVIRRKYRDHRGSEAAAGMGGVSR